MSPISFDVRFHHSHQNHHQNHYHHNRFAHFVVIHDAISVYMLPLLLLIGIYIQIINTQSIKDPHHPHQSINDSTPNNATTTAATTASMTNLSNPFLSTSNHLNLSKSTEQEMEKSTLRIDPNHQDDDDDDDDDRNGSEKLSPYRISPRIVLLMKILHMLQQQRNSAANNNSSTNNGNNNYNISIASSSSPSNIMNSSTIQSNNNQNNQNVSASESRSVISWLRFRKPSQSVAIRPEAADNQLRYHLLPPSSNSPPPQLQPLFPPAIPTTTGGAATENDIRRHHNGGNSRKSSSSKNPENRNHPNSYYLLPSSHPLPPLTDTSSIDYWLKFVEQANIADSAIPLFGAGGGGQAKHKLAKRKRVPMFKRVKPNNRNNNNNNNNKSKASGATSTKQRASMNKIKNYNNRNKIRFPSLANGESGEDSNDAENSGGNNSSGNHQNDEDDENNTNNNNNEDEDDDYENHNNNRNNNRNNHNHNNNKNLKSNYKYSNRNKTNFSPSRHQQQQQLDSKLSNSHTKHHVLEYDSTSPRCDKFTDEICIDDFEYPEHAILDEIYKRKDIFQLMYSEVKGDTPMVDGIPRDEEENFSQDYYYGNNDNSESEDYDSYPPNGGAYSNRTENDLYQDAPDSDSGKSKNSKIGFVCRSEVLYAKPKLARNIKGKWRVIVNAGDFTQTVRMEKCIKPNSECRFIAEHKYDSRCAQVNAIHRLLVFEKGKGFYIDTFRVPTACTCHVHSTKSDNVIKYGTSSYSSEGTSNHAKSKSKSKSKSKIKSNLGDTLWPLLGTDESAAGNRGKQNQPGQNYILLPEKSNNLRQNLNINLDLLKLLPQLTSIAPEQVLQQLLEDYVDPASRQPIYGHRLRNDLTDHNRGSYHSQQPQLQPQQQPHYYHHQHTKLSNQDDELRQLLLDAASPQRDSSIEYSRALLGKGAGSESESESSQFFRPIEHTTKLVHSTGGSGGGSGGSGSPFVQLIHVPLSADIVSADMGTRVPLNVEDAISSGNNANNADNRQHTYRHHFWPVIQRHPLSGDKHLGFDQSKYLISSDSNYLFSPSKSNSSVSSPPPPPQQSSLFTNRTQSTAKEKSKIVTSISGDDDDDATTKKIQDGKNQSTTIIMAARDNASSEKDIKHILDKKVNFSYHPILEYIVN